MRLTLKPKENVVFVYGSLKKGFGNHKVLNDSKFLKAHITKPNYTMYDYYGSFPAVDDKGNTAIHGELYSVSADTLKDLDHLEGVPHFYKRSVISTPVGNAIMYLINTGDDDLKDKEIINTGIWVEHTM